MSRSPDVVVPNLFVIGASKCGTTALHAYLDVAPGVSMTANKEPHFLARPNWRERIREYATLFDPGAPIRGESSTGYTAYPWAAEVPDRMKEIAAGARLIYMVRDPIERALANFDEDVHYGWRHGRFASALAWPDAPRNNPIWASRYATQLERYLQRFPQENVLVLDQARLKNERRAALADVFGFLGVEVELERPEFDAVHNTRALHRAPNVLGRAVQRRRHRPVTIAVEERSGLPRTVLRTALTKPLRQVELNDGERERLVELLAPEADRFRALTGMAFADWSV